MRGDQVHLNCSFLPRVLPLWSQAIRRSMNPENTYLVGGASTPLATWFTLPCCLGTSFRPIRSQLVAPKIKSCPLHLDPSSF